MKLILDAAHMSDTRVNGVSTGALNGIDVTVCAYRAVGNLESSMIYCADDCYDIIVRKLRWLGINEYTYVCSDDNDTYKWKQDVKCVDNKDHGNSIMETIALV